MSFFGRSNRSDQPPPNPYSRVPPQGQPSYGDPYRAQPRTPVPRYDDRGSYEKRSMDRVSPAPMRQRGVYVFQVISLVAILITLLALRSLDLQVMH